MSLFIGTLAFPGDPAKIEAAKLGTLAGSLLSALAGWAVLRFAKPVEGPKEDVAEAREIFGEDWDDMTEVQPMSEPARPTAADRR
jgi:NhaA family Na+:H+ antiporter